MLQRTDSVEPARAIARIARRTFTLIELMVVISLITILASLLLPALGSVKQCARKLTCLSNMRQIGQGTMMYVSDFNGWMPPTTYNAQHIAYINLYFNAKCDLWDSTSVGSAGCLSFSPANRKPSGAFFYCPSLYARASDSPYNQGGGSSNYYYSNYMQTRNIMEDNELLAGCWSSNIAGSGGTPNPFRRLERIKDMSVILGESNYIAPLNPTYNQCANLYTGSKNLLCDMASKSAPAWNLHGNSACFLFKDAHVQSYKWLASGVFGSEFIPL